MVHGLQGRDNNFYVSAFMSYYNQFTSSRWHWQGSDTNKADHLNEIIMLQMHFWNVRYHRTKPQNVFLRGNVQKKKSLFKDIIQIKVDHPPSYPIFDKLFFDKF